MTDAERALWRLLRDRRIDGSRFRRQQPIDRYIVDFVCFEARSIVEVDGGQHYDPKAAERGMPIYSHKDFACCSGTSMSSLIGTASIGLS